jgi:hypothetical protein
MKKLALFLTDAKRQFKYTELQKRVRIHTMKENQKLFAPFLMYIDFTLYIICAHNLIFIIFVNNTTLVRSAVTPEIICKVASLATGCI